MTVTRAFRDAVAGFSCAHPANLYYGSERHGSNENKLADLLSLQRAEAQEKYKREVIAELQAAKGPLCQLIVEAKASFEGKALLKGLSRYPIYSLDDPRIFFFFFFNGLDICRAIR